MLSGNMPRNMAGTFLSLNSVSSDLIDESCTECQPNVPEGVTLKKRYPATPNLIKQDPMRIKQVLSNLISNALKNTVQGLSLIHI